MFWLLCALVSSAAIRDGSAAIGDGAVDLGSTDIRSARTHDDAFVAEVAPEPTAAALTLADIARRLPAVNLRETGGSFAFTTLSLRGSTASQVAVYLDGVPLAPASVGAVDLSTLLVLDLGRVEVFRGFAPAELGPDGLFGALVLHTRDESEGYRSNVTVGSFGTRQLSGAWSGFLGAGHLSVAATYAGTNGNFPYFNDNGTPLNTHDDSIQPRKDNDENAGTVRAAYTHALGSALLRAQAMAFGKDQGTPPPVSEDSTARYQLVRPQFSLAMEHWRFSPHWQLDASLQSITNAAHITNTAPQSFTDENQEEETLRFNGVVRFSPLPALRFTGSLLAENDNFNDSFAHAFAERAQGGGSLGCEFFHDWLRLSLTSRLDGASDRGASGNANRVWAQPELSVNARAFSWLSFAAHGGYRERLPTFAERFGDAGIVRGNLTLKPESVWAADIGGKFENHFLALEAVYSEAHANDLIVFVLGGLELPQAQNIDTATVRTAEFTGSLTPWRYAALDFNYTYQFTQNDTPGAEHDQPLPGRPQNYARAALAFYTPWHVRLMYEFVYVGDSYLDRDGTDLAPGRYPQNIRIAWQHGPLVVSVDMTNIFDQTTARVALPAYSASVTRPIVDFLGYPLPGRSVFASITYAFGDDQKAWEKSICAVAC